jgi:hypothetical protein
MPALIAFAVFLSVNTFTPQPASRPEAAFCQWRGGQDDDTGRAALWPSARCGDAGVFIAPDGNDGR